MSIHEWLGSYDTGWWYTAVVVVTMAIYAIKGAR